MKCQSSRCQLLQIILKLYSSIIQLACTCIQVTSPVSCFSQSVRYFGNLSKQCLRIGYLGALADTFAFKSLIAVLPIVHPRSCNYRLVHRSDQPASACHQATLLPEMRSSPGSYFHIIFAVLHAFFGLSRTDKVPFKICIFLQLIDKVATHMQRFALQLSTFIQIDNRTRSPHPHGHMYR